MPSDVKEIKMNKTLYARLAEERISKDHAVR